jgi:tRNA (guanine37-N1)-methyltransferase
MVIHDIRDHAEPPHRVTDDYPYGGGQGMVMKPEPLFGAVEAAKAAGASGPVVLLSPQGEVFDQAMAAQLAELSGMTLVCGRYEGVDERFREGAVDREISIGDYVLTGGELAAMVVMDAVARLKGGVLGNEASAGADSFQGGLLEHPQYTRPPVFRDRPVPGVLLSGDHGAIARWRRAEALRRTLNRRPDLLARAALSPEDRRILGNDGEAEGENRSG